MMWVLLLLVVLLAGFAGGYVAALRRMPRILARMSAWELRYLAGRVARHRPIR